MINSSNNLWSIFNLEVFVPTKWTVSRDKKFSDFFHNLILSFTAALHEDGLASLVVHSLLNHDEIDSQFRHIQFHYLNWVTPKSRIDSGHLHNGDQGGRNVKSEDGSVEKGISFKKIKTWNDTTFLGKKNWKTINTRLT